MNKNVRNTLLVLGLAVSGAVGGAISTSALNTHSYARTFAEVAQARLNLQSAGDLSSVFKTVDKAVEPSVVQIQTRTTVSRAAMRSPFQGLMPFGNDQGTLEMPQQNLVQQGTGSGVIMEVSGKTGYILTNNHVVDHAQSMNVTLSDGRTAEGKLVGVDPRTDLAVVQITIDNLIPATWGQSDSLEKGDWVIAFGSPLGYVGSMTHGIVSALNRTVGILGQAGFEEFIQTDAPINPGNSGGPLVNTRGEVVGINSCIASQSGGSQGIGFAVPTALAKPVFDHLKADGKMNRGWLGVAITDVNAPDESVKEHLSSAGFKGTSGVLVSQVMRDGPADKHLQADDVVTEINGKPVKDLHSFRQSISTLSPNTDVKLTVFRDGRNQDITVKLGEQVAEVDAQSDDGGTPQRLFRRSPEQARGMMLRNLNENLARENGLEAGEAGALVTGVLPNSAAARAGLKSGDLITAVNGKPVKDAAEASKAVKDSGDKNIRLTVSNRDGSRIVIMKDKTTENKAGEK